MLSSSSGLSGAPLTVERAAPYAEIASLSLISFAIVAMIPMLLSQAMPVCPRAVYLSISSIILLRQSGMFASQLAYRQANQLSCLAHDGQILARGDDEDTRRRSRHGNI